MNLVHNKKKTVLAV